MSPKPIARSHKRKGTPKTGAARRPAPLKWLLSCAAILLLTFVVYIPSLDNDFTNWDDTTYVTKNPLLAHPDFNAILKLDLNGNYHPLTIWSLVLDYRLSGLNPRSYHWLNLLLHLANTALVFLLLRRLTGGRFWTSVAGSLFFGIHPMHVESVAWVSERKDVLYAFFFLIGLIVYLRYLEKRHGAWLAATLAAFLLSLAAKPAAVVFPLVLLLLDWYRRRTFTPLVFLEKIPFFASSIAMGLLTLSAQKATGAMASSWSPFHKLVFACFGTVMYFVKLFVPIGLSAIYPYPNFEGQGPGPEFYVAFAAVLLLLPVAVIACRRSRVIAFGLGFFLVNIFLVLQFTTVGQAVMADRYTYLPYIGLFFTLAWWLDDPPGARPGPSWLRPLIWGVLLLLLPFSLYQTWRRCDVWQNSETMWSDVIRQYPHRVYFAYAFRGAHYRDVTKDLHRAEADFDEAIALSPKVEIAWNEKGMLLASQGRLDSALVCFDNAVRLKPGFAAARSNRGVVRLNRGEAAAAVADLSAAIEADPLLIDARTNRALAYIRMGDHERALADLRSALELEPGHPNNHVYWNAVGVELAALNRYREALDAFDRAIRIAPENLNSRSDYYYNRSRTWWALGDKTRALADAQEARRLGAAIDPGYLRAIGG